MIRPIVRDTLFLSKKAEKAVREDVFIGKDLMDTLNAHRDSCVGMAANMIGFNKRIIIVNMGFFDLLMYNPKIIKKEEPYETEEGCLSLDGVRKTVRHRKIRVEYCDKDFRKYTQDFNGRIAQIIEHEVDHLSGILI